MSSNLAHTYQSLFNSIPLIVRSPGRVNLIGEHTDYNEGFVLPAAIDKAVYVAAGKRNDNRVALYAVQFDEQIEIILDDRKPSKHWSTYILGVADQLMLRGHHIGGFNIVVDGDIPVGAGLSSSAAVECAVAFALNELFSLKLTKLEMVQIAQKAEHTYAGVQCGIMDQFASMFGQKDKVIKLDCRSLEYQYEPLQLDGYKLLLLNTNVKHSLASSEYNTRRQQCEQGVEWISKYHPQVKSLRDATLQQLKDHVATQDELIYRRCKYVVEENERLLTGCAELEKGNIAALGKKMFATHDGLSRDYEVSCPELDYLVDAVRNHPDVLGARMMGGGFGGCTINIIRETAIDALVEKLSVLYEQQMKLPLTSYVAQIEDGTGIVGRS